MENPQVVHIKLDGRTVEILRLRADRQRRSVSSLARIYIEAYCQQPEGGGSLKEKSLLA